MRLRDKHLQVRLASDLPELEVAPTYLINTDVINKQNIQTAVVGVIAIVVAKKLLDTACEVVLIKVGK